MESQAALVRPYIPQLTKLLESQNRHFYKCLQYYEKDPKCEIAKFLGSFSLDDLAAKESKQTLYMISIHLTSEQLNDITEKCIKEIGNATLPKFVRLEDGTFLTLYIGMTFASTAEKRFHTHISKHNLPIDRVLIQAPKSAVTLSILLNLHGMEKEEICRLEGALILLMSQPLSSGTEIQLQLANFTIAPGSMTKEQSILGGVRSRELKKGIHAPKYANGAVLETFRPLRSLKQLMNGAMLFHSEGTDVGLLSHHKYKKARVYTGSNGSQQNYFEVTENSLIAAGAYFSKVPPKKNKDGSISKKKSKIQERVQLRIRKCPETDKSILETKDINGNWNRVERTSRAKPLPEKMQYLIDPDRYNQLDEIAEQHPDRLPPNYSKDLFYTKQGFQSLATMREKKKAASSSATTTTTTTSNVSVQDAAPPSSKPSEQKAKPRSFKRLASFSKPIAEGHTRSSGMFLIANRIEKKRLAGKRKRDEEDDGN